jgi:hypothetical protein
MIFWVLYRPARSFFLSSLPSRASPALSMSRWCRRGDQTKKNERGRKAREASRGIEKNEKGANQQFSLRLPCARWGEELDAELLWDEHRAERESVKERKRQTHAGENKPKGKIKDSKKKKVSSDEERKKKKLLFSSRTRAPPSWRARYFFI